MNRHVTQFFSMLVESYLFLIIAALLIGLLLPGYAIVLAPFATLFLQIIFFLTSLKINLSAVTKAARNYKMLISANIFMLIIFPVVVYLIAAPIAPSLAIALLLLAAMPTGMTAPLLTEVVGGRASVALVLTLTTSLLAPFTIPVVISLLAKTAVTVSAFAMFWSLVKIIIIPFILAQVVRYFVKRRIEPAFVAFKPISIILLGLLIAGVVSKQAEVMLQDIGVTLITQLIVLFAFISILLFAGYFITYWRSRKDRLTVSVCLTFMNFTLAIYLAGEFFSDPQVLFASVLVVFPWALMLIPYKWVTKRLWAS